MMLCVLVISVVLCGQRGGGPFPGGNESRWIAASYAPLTRLFTQDAYTEYAILAPGSEQFPHPLLAGGERAGATELVNATRGGKRRVGYRGVRSRTGIR